MRAVDQNSSPLVAVLLAHGGKAVADAGTVQRAEALNLGLTQAAAAAAAVVAVAATEDTEDAAAEAVQQVDTADLQSSNEIVRTLLKVGAEGVTHAHEAYAAGLLIPEWEQQQAAEAAAAQAAAEAEAEAAAAAEEDEQKEEEKKEEAAADENVVAVEVEVLA